MTLVDSNIFMYAAGRDHPLKTRATAFLERVARGSVAATVDSEVLQEILQRYRSLGRWMEGRLVYDAARLVFTDVIPVTADVMDYARQLLDEYGSLMARDAVHAAVVTVSGLESITSFDRDFDRVKGLRRIEP